MKYEYLLVLLGTLLFPLLRSFDANLRLWREWRALLGAIGSVLLLFGLWDIAATLRGHWSFNPAHVLDMRILFLPLEEWLFFIVVPFVTIFTWESVKYFERRRRR